MEDRGVISSRHAPVEEKWAKNLGVASEYMNEARRSNNPGHHDGSERGSPTSPTSRRSASTPELEFPRKVVHVASVERISAARWVVRDTLGHYEKRKDIDANIESMWNIAQKFDMALYYLEMIMWHDEETLTGRPPGNFILDILDVKADFDRAMRQLLETDTSQGKGRESRPTSFVSSVGPDGEQRISWICSFRQHTSMKLMNTIRELQSHIDLVLDIVHSYVFLPTSVC